MELLNFGFPSKFNSQHLIQVSCKRGEQRIDHKSKKYSSVKEVLESYEILMVLIPGPKCLDSSLR